MRDRERGREKEGRRERERMKPIIQATVTMESQGILGIVDILGETNKTHQVPRVGVG